MAKDFLNSGILGGGAGFADGAGFRAVKIDDISSPDYDPRFFETFPTVWASAYAFRKSLEQGNETAMEEWATLFLLHYFGVLHLNSFNKSKLDVEYDKDLWAAFHGTYPKTKDDIDLQSVGILQTDDRTVVGAYFPQVVFFPSRGRDNWQESENLKPFLDGETLSWNKAGVLLEDSEDRQRFHLHLRSIAQFLSRKELKTLLENFCNLRLGSFEGELATLSINPSDWETVGKREINKDAFLQEYPLQKPNSEGGTIYYLLENFEFDYQSPKLTDKISSNLPSPTLYRKKSNRVISVRYAGNAFDCELNEKDEIMMLKDLFLGHSPYWCKVPKVDDKFATLVSIKHEISLQDSSIKETDRAICLAPVKAEFFRHFPEVLNDAKNIKAEPDANGNVMWTFFVCDKEIRWRNKPINQINLPTSTLAMYPPKISPQWKLYAAFGTGDKETCGRWHLIDERGWQGQMVNLEDEEYISILHRTDGARNRPKALLFTDAGDKERGVLFLGDVMNVDVDAEQNATLSMDFGTSNTCMAVKTSRKSETLSFSLSPLPLWGIPSQLETPGFVPRKWGGEKGFFPTILLSRKSDDILPTVEPNNLQLEHLFKTDIPCLHKGMGQRLVANQYDTDWRIHDDLKWNADQRTPWRSLFLQLTLLYAHAEVFFNKSAKIDKYVFTYPLAFSEEFGNTYHDRAEDAIRQIRHYSYGEEKHLDDKFTYLKMDESSAIAKSLRQGGMQGLLEVFVDIGGGTADIAIRHKEDFLVLDSLKVAGRNFFSIAQKTLGESEIVGSSQFRGHLQRLLGQDPKDIELKLPLGSLYSVQINELDDRTFREREESILQKGMGGKSFQRYRSQLFFSHLLAYALNQACAATVSHKINLTNGIKLILGGNCWGLLLFAEWKRSAQILQNETNNILQLIKKNILEDATEEEKQFLEKTYLSGLALLNEQNLSDAKNSVALGALQATGDGKIPENTEPYAGINIGGLEINNLEPHTIRWSDRWSFPAFIERFGNMRQINSSSFEHPEQLNSPIDKNLTVFTGIGNTSQIGVDNLPADQWQQLNGELIGSISGMTVEGGKLVVLNSDGERISSAPLNYFLSRVLYPTNNYRDFLDVLADKNDCLYK